MINDDDVRRNLAENLCRILAERGISQRGLAAMTGDPVMTISRVCRGENLVRAGVRGRIAEALDVSADRLMGPPPKKFSKIEMIGVDTAAPNVVQPQP